MPKRSSTDRNTTRKNGAKRDAAAERWLLLIHQLPPKPAYFRVKIWRRLQQLGAVAIKNSVYVLPNNDSTYESFQWVMREITQGKGDATICNAGFVDGLSDRQVEGLFVAARDSEYQALAEELRKLAKIVASGSKKLQQRRTEIDAEIRKARKKLGEIVAIDFFGASGRETVVGILDGIEARLRASEPGAARIGKSAVSASELQGRTWVTRRGIQVDRIASAWLIQRFIDPKASFKFVDGKTYEQTPGELRFDMFQAEFTHEGDSCTFEVLIERARLDDPALRQIGEIIHDLDLQDGKYGREDTAGIGALLNSISAAHARDEDRLVRGNAVLNDLYDYFSRRRK